MITFPLHLIVDGACGCGDSACDRAGKHPAESWKYIDPNRPELSPTAERGVGIATGARSGVFVIDLDVKGNGYENFRALGECPETYAVATPTGGFHLYFKHPGFPVKNSVSMLAPGVDVRGDGGYVVAPCSPHKNGGRYELVADLPIADAPAWLLARPELRHADSVLAGPAVEAEARFARMPKAWRIARAKAWLETQPPAVEGQGGDAHTWTTLTRAVHDNGLTDADMIADAFVEWNALCEPPWGGKEWAHKVSSVLHHSTVPWSTDLDTCYRIETHEGATRGLTSVADPRDVVLSEIAAACAKVKPTGEVVSFGGLKFKYGHYDQILAPIEYQVDSILGVGDVAMLVAHGNSLKTWLALSLAQAIASGHPWLGQYAVRRGRVGLLDFESGEYEVMRRFKLLGVTDQRVGDRLLRASMPAADFEQWGAWEDLALARFDQIVIDSFAAATSAKENEKEAARLLTLAGKFAETFGAGVLVIHHERKGSGGDVRESVRGSTAIYAACDRIYGFTAPESLPSGAIRTTMTPDIKHGAGNRAPCVTVELTNAGLTWVAPAVKPKTTPAERIQADIITYLKRCPMGASKSTLLEAITGDSKTVKTVIAQMLPAGLVGEFSQGREKIIKLSANVGTSGY